MAHSAITESLNSLRQRERLLAAAWGAARWFAVVLAALAMACLMDWWVDRRCVTPHWMRLSLLSAQVIIAGAAAWIWIIVPVIRRRPDSDVALFVESQRPELTHRLISAVQLNRPGADVTHMSSQLIRQVTAEAASVAQSIDFPALADHRRLRWGLRLAGGVALAAAVLLLLAPATVSALIRRQLLADVAVPRRVTLADRTPGVQPAAEPVILRIAVDGRGPYAGVVQVVPDSGPAERVAVAADPVDGIVSVTLAAPAGDFTFEAWLGDGRLPEPGRVRLVPRPAVTEMNARLILPTFVGRRPDGLPFESLLPRGDVSGIPGCSARVTVRTQKPVTRATLELLGPGDAHSAGPPRVTRSLEMPPDAAHTSAGATFDLRAGEAGYRVVVVDEHGFRNLDPPRRDVRLLAEDPPLVTLLAEQFRPEGFVGVGEEFEVEGVPVPLGGAVRVAYSASHAYGLGRAFLVYRVVAANTATSADGAPRPTDELWQRLPLSETPAAGTFDLRRGTFADSRPGDQIQFHAVESTDANLKPGRLDGGGRFDFQTRGLPGVQAGATLEYFVEVTNRNPNHPLAGRSETRAKKIVTVGELMTWIDATLRQEDRIRRLADRQRGVFDK